MKARSALLVLFLTAACASSQTNPPVELTAGSQRISNPNGTGTTIGGPVAAQVGIDGKRCQIRGTVCMDQVVVDLGDARPVVGSDVIVFGPPAAGGPTAQDWAEACGTINYEIVTRVGGRVPRVAV